MGRNIELARQGGAAVMMAGLAITAYAGDQAADHQFTAALSSVNIESLSLQINQGTITLEGTVESSSQKKAATLAVAKLPGVFSVVNRLECNAPAQIQALAIRDVFDKALGIMPIPDDMKVRHRQIVSGEREDDFCMVLWHVQSGKPALLVFIDVLDDTITLAGTVWNEAQRVAISAAIADEAGGRKIQNRLRVLQVIEGPDRTMECSGRTSRR